MIQQQTNDVEDGEEEWQSPPPPRCGQMRCGYYAIETDPPMKPPLWACSRRDCRWAIRPLYHQVDG